MREGQEADLPTPGSLGITDVVGAVIAGLDPTLPGARVDAQQSFGIPSVNQAVVIMVDGLGWVPLNSHLGYAPTLRGHLDTTSVVHTVAPSTTAAAITAFATGQQPGATRMVGYSVLGESGVMNLLAFAPGVDPQLWQAMPTHFEQLAQVGVESAVVSPSGFAGSGLTRAALRGARHAGALGWEDRVRVAVEELRAGTPLVYLYWSGIDHEGHIHGVASQEWEHALEEFDAGLAILERTLPPGVAAVLTADHGMVDTAPELLIDLATTPALDEHVAAIAGEARAVHVHATDSSAMIERWSDVLADQAWVVAREDLADYLGEGPGLDLVGDAMVFMKGRAGIVDSRVQSQRSIAQMGLHGSLTSDEMLIPVMVIA